MKNASYVLAIVGILLLLYATVGRFIGGPTVFGFVMPLQPKVVVLGSNSVLLLAVLAALYGSCSGKPQG